MKKLLLLILGAFIITGCNKNTTAGNIKFTEYSGEDNMSGITYKFTGKSDHFAFTTGKVYYSNMDRQLFITNFKTIKEIENMDYFNVSVSFNNTIVYYHIIEKEEFDELGIEDSLKNIRISEIGFKPQKDKEGKLLNSTNAFLNTYEANFKKNIKITIKYCYQEKCNKEKIELSYK